MFEEFEQQTGIELDKPLEIIEKIFDGIEDFLGISDEDEATPEDMFEYLESVDPNYTYEKVELPNGVIRESIVWETTSDAYDVYNIEDATDTWHIQEYSDTCAIACQEFILEEYTDMEFDETELAIFAYENGWYEEGGTSLEDVGKLLEYHGVDTTTDYNADFQDLENALDNGDRAIVAVYNMGLDNDYEGFYPTWSANHAVEVIGIDRSNPDDIKVIVNDPGVEDGCGKVIDYDVFMNAWNTSDGFMMVADRP